MLYIVEDTEYCMLISHERGTLYNNLRYGIARDSLRTTEIYNYSYRSKIKQTCRYIKRYKMLENLHRSKKDKDITCKVRVTHEGKHVVTCIRNQKRR